MLLKEHLEKYTKEQLLDEVRSFELRKYSGLRKDSLIERIIEFLCSEDVLRSRLACLTKDQMILFRKACDEPQFISMNEVVDSIQLHMYHLGNFAEKEDRFLVFEEVSSVFKRIDDEAFESDQYKKGWMMQCIHFFIDYYGIAPLEVIYELYKLKVNDSIDEMIDIIDKMPIDIIESCILPAGSLNLQDIKKVSRLYSSKGLLIHLPILENDEEGYLLDYQMDKDFYIPSKHQIEEICKIGYEASSLAYKKLQAFLIKKLNLSYEQSVSWSLQVWANSYAGESTADIINKMSDSDVAFKNENQMNEFMEVLMEAHNSTRMKENRGHNPKELTRKELVGKRITIAPDSSHTAGILRDVASQLKEMGISVDLDGNADTVVTSIYPGGLGGKAVSVEKKIYPNDLCPCGSGKKYKKCCGRK